MPQRISREKYVKAKELLKGGHSLRVVSERLSISRGTVESISKGKHYFDTLSPPHSRSSLVEKIRSRLLPNPEPPPVVPDLPGIDSAPTYNCPECGGKIYGLPCWLCYIRWECNTAGDLPHRDASLTPPFLPPQSPTFHFTSPETPEESRLAARIRAASRLKSDGLPILGANLDSPETTEAAKQPSSNGHSSSLQRRSSREPRKLA